MPKGYPKSGKNKGWFSKNHPAPHTEEQHAKIGKAVSMTNKGRKLPKWWRKKISQSMRKRTGKMQFKKKLGNTAYLKLHRMMRRLYGAPQLCDKCGRTKPPLGKGKTYDYFHWASKAGKYSEDRNDWSRLCAICHRQLELKMNAA